MPAGVIFLTGGELYPITMLSFLRILLFSSDKSMNYVLALALH